MRKVFILLFVLLTASLANAQTIYYVKPGGTGDGSSWTTAGGDLQAIINAAPNGTSIWVAAGTYQRASGQAFSMKEGVKIYGGFVGNEIAFNQRDWLANETILEGNNSRVVMNNNNGLTAAAVLDGFTITGGSNIGGDGGGMYNALCSPTLANCNFSGNTASYGGGIYNDASSSPSFTNCSFSENISTDGFGGGIFNSSSSPTFTNCSFSGNTASTGYGGGIYNTSSSSPALTDCSFSGNRAFYGGGICNYFFASPILINCSVSGNTASYGGGMYNEISLSPILINCSVSGNTATDGGGIYNTNSSSPIISNTIVYNNSSGIVNNDGSCIPVITYSLIENYSYNSNDQYDLANTTDPLFVNAPSYNTAPFTDGDYHLQASSPCINTGNNDSLQGTTTDITGAPRIQNGTVDMGAFEFQSITTPVTYLRFSGNMYNGTANLQWISGVESNFDHYEVQKSTNAMSYLTIESVPGKGSSNSYNLSVLQTESLAYYRLKLVDRNGSFTTSNTIQLQQNGSGYLQLYPNPATTELHLQVTTAVRLDIYNATGALVRTAQLSAGANAIDIQSLAKGSYIGRLNDTNHTTVTFIKL